MSKVVRIKQVSGAGYTYISNGETEAILPANPQEAKDILDGFMGAKQEMSEDEFKLWRQDVLNNGPIDRYVSFCTPQMFFATPVHANKAINADQNDAE